MRFFATFPALVLAAVSLTAGCATSQIPNTTVEDTRENREIVSFMEDYRHAVEERDVGRLLTMASPLYLDDNGTPGGADDLDFDELREKLTAWADRVKDVRYEIRYRRVTRDQHRVFVEYRFTASFQVAHVDGEDRWSRRVGDNRVVLTRDEDGELRMLSGM